MSDEDSGTGWEGAYASNDEVGWDTGDPQPVVKALVASDAIANPVLDVGCGLGTESCFLASEGYDVLGVDVAPTAVERALARATERGLDDRVEFAVGDALEFGTTGGVVDANEAATVLDVGVFHALGGPDSDHDDGRSAYADALARVLEPGGRAFVLSFAPGAPEDWPPDLISRRDVRDAFDADGTDGDGSDGDWRVVEFRDETFVSRGGEVPALLSVLERKRGP
ncbi:class I SAM-dependent methyltransferase [Halorubellus sp. JP-L1]|uniref:SAM-dependent methyltransferase n=1 Tax=Halorubellus sp. JP-L1 TaxID=2715753 RepID=UPI0014077D8B|nr:class I SAM-dependent methyltransferase [Halorubellus sp. JP-L1]NHN41481.1 class I SAM-dependent methyltransferase [Halorubellus sp. JP-L1]